MEITVLITKILTLALLAFYILFTIVVFNQVLVMNRIVHMVYTSTILKIASTAHIVLAISLFIAALVIL